MVPLTRLESEVLGEMAWDSYRLDEVICFIRDASEPGDQFGLYREVTTLFAAWITRGWLMLAKRPSRPHFLSSIEQILPHLERIGPDVVGDENSAELPEVELTDQAFLDVEWLRGFV